MKISVLRFIHVSIFWTVIKIVNSTIAVALQQRLFKEFVEDVEGKYSGPILHMK
jgi:hypothetical protein